MKRFPVPSLILILSFFWAAASFAATLSPGLQARLQHTPPDEEIPVIINLADKVDLGQIKEREKGLKREKIITALKDKAEKTQGPLKALLQSRNAKRMIPFWITNAIAVTVAPSVISELMSFPEIESIGVDALISSPQVLPAVVSTPEWNIARINAPALWDAGITGTGVVVANMDTGVDINHADLQSQWLGGINGWYNPYKDPANAQYCYNAGSCGTCELSELTPCDVGGHGTGTMGVMVAGSATGTSIGVAPGATWIAVKIFPDCPPNIICDAPQSIIIQGFQWLLALPAGSTPDVINNSWSWGAGVCDTTFQSSIAALKAAGIEVVFAAGNDGPPAPGHNTSESPANNPGSFAVGATDSNNLIANFSSEGPSACDGSIFPHVVAPGVDIKLAGLTAGGVFPNTYAYGSGTSFAAPHVAGAAALLSSAFPSLTPVEIETAFEKTALPLGSPVPNNIYGYGLIDGSKALSYITTQGFIAIPEISGFPASFSYGDLQINTSADNAFTITNRGSVPTTINSITSNSSDFVVSAVGDTCSGQTIASFSSCVFSVSFSPTSVGVKNGVLTISSTDPINPALDIPLTGTAIDGALISKIGVFRNTSPVARWLLDSGGEGIWQGCTTDLCYSFGLSADIPVAGSWTGSASGIGVFRRTSPAASWYLDWNGDGIWEGCAVDKCYAFGLPADIPVAGSWTGGASGIGVFRKTTPVASWYLDWNGDGIWEGCGTDKCYTFGLPADIPVVGDWTGTGIMKIGVFRPSTQQWLLDWNGNGVWEGCAVDKCYTFGLSTDKPVAGRW